MSQYRTPEEVLPAPQPGWYDREFVHDDEVGKWHTRSKQNTETDRDQGSYSPRRRLGAVQTWNRRRSLFLADTLCRSHTVTITEQRTHEFSRV